MDALDWYKDAIVYELRVRSFFDGNGDGVGDFPGLTAKLDYLADGSIRELPWWEEASAVAQLGTLDPYAVDVDAADAASRSVNDARLSRDSAKHGGTRMVRPNQVNRRDPRKTSTDPQDQELGPRLLRTDLRTCLS